MRTLIMIIEDDGNISDLLGTLLGDSGYSVVQFLDANGALEWLKTHKADLILSDIGLPGISGIQFCCLVKAEPATATMPVIMLTGMGDELTKVTALKAGADDYIVKPFSNNELLARVEAVLRRYRHNGVLHRELVSGGLTLDADSGEVHADASSVTLRPKELELLSLFLRRKGTILKYSFISEAVWGLNSVAARDTIKVTVHGLKAKLGKYAGCVKAVPGMGYRWADLGEI